MENKLVLKYKGSKIHTFDGNDTVAEMIKNIKEWYDVEPSDLSFHLITEEEPGQAIVADNEVSERVVVDEPDKEYTIWSSSDLLDSNYQIPLVKLHLQDDGELEAEAVGDNAFDLESLKIAQNSLKSTTGRSIKDRLTRIDKSLNHSDPFFSTELYRDNIRANKGLTDDEIKDNTTNDDGSNQQGLQTLANQILVTNRDDLKALANTSKASEEKLVDLFGQITGVDYYTDKVIDQEQYDYLLDLLGRSNDKYKDSHVAPEENAYVQRLKDLTEDLIEKVLLKEDPNFYNK